MLRSFTLCMLLLSMTTVVRGEGLSDEGDQLLENVEKETILRALEQARWNKTRAAKDLGLSFGALRYRMQKLGLD